ncbi:MAG TPA: ABC transporter ATP-binding protein [Rhizomicrobium sp.]|nr:ABC transporter ATP-binding protein [Rhizomicrobium sp.]
MDEAYIEIENITRRFGEVIAVDDVSLTMGRGEFFALLGPSGCGKTTLLRLLAGFEFPDAGEIYIDGHEVTGLPPNRRPTNMVFQSYAIFPHLNVFDNIAYGLRRERLARAELQSRVADALAMIRLEGFAARRADQLSGGQRQRVALARALVCRPKVLLLDEPLGALDKRLRESMQVELRQLQKSLGITFVFVTHDQEEALSMSDRVAVMSAGKVLQIAPPRTLYERPNCREVADFIGTMNFVEGTVAAAEDGVAVVNAGAFGYLRVPAATGHAAGQAILLAIRPEKVAISREAGDVRGMIASTAYLGARSHFGVLIEGRAEPVAVAMSNAGGHKDLASGETVHLSFPPNAFVVLPG